MVSFGMIKTASAVGGAVVAVRSPELRAAMQDIQAGWPIQRRRAYAGKLLKMAVLATFNDPRRFAVLHRLLTLLGADLDTMINTSTRSFAHGEALWAKIRRRPSAGLLALLTRRLTTFDPTQVAERARAGDALAARLPAAYRHPGDGLLRRTHWLFPVWAPDPDALVAELASAGDRCEHRDQQPGRRGGRGRQCAGAGRPADGLDRLPAELPPARRGRSGPADRRLARGRRRWP